MLHPNHADFASFGAQSHAQCHSAETNVTCIRNVTRVNWSTLRPPGTGMAFLARGLAAAMILAWQSPAKPSAPSRGARAHTDSKRRGRRRAGATADSSSSGATWLLLGETHTQEHGPRRRQGAQGVATSRENFRRRALLEHDAVREQRRPQLRDEEVE